MEVSILRSLHATKVQSTTLEKIVRITQTSFMLKSLTERARKHYKTGEKAKGDRIKKLLLPAFAPAGYLLDGKGRNNLVGLTGLCFIDIDHGVGVSVRRCKEKLVLDNHVLFASKSISGKGLHIIVPYTLLRDDSFASLPRDPKSLNQIYGKVFDVIAAFYRQLLVVPIDEAVRNAERLCLVSYDPEAVYHPIAQPFEITY